MSIHYRDGGEERLMAPGPGARRSPSTLVLPRDELVESLERATSHRVTVISAPPGSGKTFLFRQWADAAAASRRVVTVAVRRSERDAQGFLLSLLQAILGDGEIAATPE